MNDIELISRIVKGDQRAFLALYDRYSSRVYTLIFHMLNDEMLAEEVLQETFLIELSNESRTIFSVRFS